MPELDLFTISTVVAALAAINATALFMVWRINPTIPGLAFWSLSQIFYVCAWLLAIASMNGILENSAFTALNNSLSLCGRLFLVEGTLRFRGFGNPQTRRPYLLAAMLVVIVISILNRDLATRRYLWHDGIVMFALATAALAMIRRAAAHERIVHGMAAGFFVLEGGAVGYRWMTAFTLPKGEVFPTLDVNPSIFTLVALCALGWVFGLMLSVNMRLRQQMLSLSRIDPLTELANRRHLEMVMTRNLSRLERGGPGFSICFFDLDQFKQVNDRYGHAGGDAMLLAVANRLRAVTGSNELAARIGGDEFVVVLNDTSSPTDVLTTCDRLRAALEMPVTVGEHSIPVRISLGHASAPENGRSMDSLLHHADIAMYQNKRRRRATQRPDGDGRVIPFPGNEKGRPGGAAHN